VDAVRPGVTGLSPAGFAGVQFAWRGPEMISYRAMDTRPRQQIITLIAIALMFASGANDVASFTRLGGVFTSVMTGNIVLWGLAAAQRSVSLFSHTAVSIAGYIAGVAGGTWVAHGFKVRHPDRAWSARWPGRGRTRSTGGGGSAC
jgi:Protein of unknown function (DUF1275)